MKGDGIDRIAVLIITLIFEAVLIIIASWFLGWGLEKYGVDFNLEALVYICLGVRTATKALTA